MRWPFRRAKTSTTVDDLDRRLSEEDAASARARQEQNELMARLIQLETEADVLARQHLDMPFRVFKRGH